MTIKQFIERAIEGGWTSKIYEAEAEMGFVNEEAILLDPEAWKAVGKVEGWTTVKTYNTTTSFKGERWQWNMHRMIDALAEGKSIEQFLETI